MSQQSSEDGTIEDMWKNAMEEFERRVPGKNFKERAISTTPEDLRNQIEALGSEDGTKGKNPKPARAKDIGLKVLDVVTTLGGAAADAVSIAFGPAQVCFGALSIFLSIPRKVHEFHELMESVFIELDPVLSQFDIFIKLEKDHPIHDNLKIHIHKVMANFVKLCAIVIGVQQGGKWEKFKVHAIRVFGDDQELQEEFEKFRGIVRGLQNVQGTATLQNVVETRSVVTDVQRGVLENQRSLDGLGINVKILVDEQNKGKRDEQKKGWLSDIRKHLGIKEDDSGNPKQLSIKEEDSGNPKQLGIKEEDSDDPKLRQKKLAGNRLKDTGTWLLKNERFKNWADRHHSDADSVLFLTGTPGFGKSTLISTVIEHLRDQASTLGQDRRSLISYYFLPPQKDRNIDQDSLAETALKWVAFQLAEQDNALCKNLAAVLPKRAGDLKTAGFEGLWEMLKIGSPSPRTTNYLIFDDVDKFSESARQQFAQILTRVSDRDVDQCSMKVLVCGNLDTDTFIPGGVKEDTVIEINIDTMKEDFRQYISQKLQEQKMLPGPGCGELRQRLEDKILTTPGCSFRTIDIATKGIERLIATSGDENDMFQAVDRSTQGEDDVMQETLTQLQTDLGPAQITLINEILIWVAFGNTGYETDEFEVPALEAALRLREHEVKRPIEGVANFITSRARGLMRIAGSGTTIVLEDGAKKAVFKPRAVSRRTEPPRISLEIKIVNADLPTARRFFWDLAKHVTLDQFDFSTNSPNAQATDIKGTIAVNPVDAHLAIVQATMDFLDKPPSPDTEQIGDYLVTHFPQNLNVLFEATDLDAIDNDLKSKIGKFVYNLFADPQIIERHWITFQYNMRLLLCGDSMAEFWNWLEDKAATSALGIKDKEWLEECRESDDKTGQLLQGVMGMVARLWLQDPDSPHTFAIYWIRALLAKVWQPRAEGEVDPMFDLKPSVDIAAAEAWCRKKLNVAEGEGLDSLWYERLAQTFDWFPEMNQEAVLTYEKAAKLTEPEPASWNTMIGLSDALLKEATKKEDQRKAVAIKEDALTIYRVPKGSEITTEQKLVELEEVAQWYGKFGQPDKAFEYRKSALELAPENGEAQYAIIAHYIITSQDQEIQTVLQTVLAGNTIEVDEPKRESGRLVPLIKSIIRHDMGGVLAARFQRIISAAMSAGILNRLWDDFDEAIGDNKNSDYGERMQYFIRLLYKGLGHYFNAKLDPGEIKRALEIWADALSIAHTHYASGNPPPDLFYERVTEMQGKHYFDQAKRNWSILQAQSSIEEEAKAQLLETIFEYTQKMERNLGEYEQAIPNGELTAAKCYKAAFLALQGDLDGARGTFKPDMVQVINMLSDDEESNDSFALYKLRGILLYAGDYQNAVAGTVLVSPPTIGDEVPGRMRNALEKLFSPRGKPEEWSPASQLLILFDVERGTDQPLSSVVKKLVDEAAKHALPPSRSPQIESETTATANESEETQSDQNPIPNEPEETPIDQTLVLDESEETPSVQDPIPDKDPVIEDDSNDVDDLKAWEDLHKVLVQVQSESLIGKDHGSRYCNNCLAVKFIANQWDFDNNFYGCKYCYDMDLCEKCHSEITAADRDPDEIQAVCSSTHDWVFLPKWTIESWVESVRMIVRVPRKDDQGDIITGDETMELPEWLNKVTEPWGGVESGKTWDQLKSPVNVPNEEAKLEISNGSGDEKEEKVDEKGDEKEEKGDEKEEKGDEKEEKGDEKEEKSVDKEEDSKPEKESGNQEEGNKPEYEQE